MKTLGSNFVGDKLSKDLLYQVQQGLIKPNQPILAERKLAKKYGISHMTARKVIEDLVKESLLYRIQGKGTFVKEPPAKLKKFKILIPKIVFHKHSFYFDVIKGCEVATNREVELSIQTYEMENLESFASAIKESDSDGFLSMASPNIEEETSILKETKTPFVLVGHYSPDQGFYAIYSDFYQGTFQMTEYLIKKGHKKIALLGGLHSISPLGRDFLRGYRDALTAHNIPVRDKWVSEGNWVQEEGYRLTKELLKPGDLPTAIFAGDDTIAVGVIRALKEEGIRIPQKMAVVGFNDLDLAMIVEPHLTTMRVPRFEMGKAGTELLTRLVRKEEIEKRQIVFKPELVIRTSSEVNM